MKVLVFWMWLSWQIVAGMCAVFTGVFRGYRDPMIVALESKCTTDGQVSVLASCITITPGTLVMGIHPNGEDQPVTLYVHCLTEPDADSALAGLRDMEARVLRVLGARR